MFDVVYSNEAEASKITNNEKNVPKWKPNNTAAMIKPMATKKPTVMAVRKKEKSFLVIKATADSPTDNAKVIVAAGAKTPG